MANYTNHPIKHDRDKIKKVIDDFWKENHRPPSIRDIMNITGITSTSAMSYIIHQVSGIRITDGGHPVPDWVDKAIEAAERRMK